MEIIYGEPPVTEKPIKQIDANFGDGTSVARVWNFNSRFGVNVYVGDQNPEAGYLLLSLGNLNKVIEVLQAARDELVRRNS